MSRSILTRFTKAISGPLLGLVLSLPVILLLIAIQGAPSVPAGTALTPEELSGVEQLLLEKAPQSPSTPGPQSLQLDRDEMNLLLRYGLEVLNLSPGWAAEIEPVQDGLQGRLSIALDSPGIPLFMNVVADLQSEGTNLRLTSVQVGRLQLPNLLLQFAINRLRENLRAASPAYDDLSQLLANVESVDISSQRMQIRLHWDPELISRLGEQTRQLFISEEDRVRIARHYTRIAEIAATIPIDLRAVSLNTFLVPMFQTALEHTQAGEDPVAENRTLFQALAVYVNEEDIARLVGTELAAGLPQPKLIEVRLQRRHDLAAHLVSIAVITTAAGADIASMLSTTKEAYDARYRSGFSFSDLTANSVGVALASLATRDAASATIIQQRMSVVTEESDYMPVVGNNRDGISETDFAAIYRDRNSPEYQQRLAEIESLIQSRPLFAGLLP